jgi:Ser/Thr protein kinase RdoA (MazF antagonist)
MSAPGPGDAAGAERDFARLSRPARIARFRGLARAALAAYDLPPARLTLLQHQWNTTFRVDTGAGRYVLRIHRSGIPTVQSVGSELAWLAALTRETALEVPAPVATRDGALLTVAAAPGLPAPCICVLLRWLPGRLLRRGLAPRHLALVGEVMGRLQNHAAGWTPPPGFARGRVDWAREAARGLPDPFAPEILAGVAARVAERLSPAEAAPVAGALARARAAEQALGPGGFGLIHADLHYRNLLFSGGAVRPIDFDDCGFGPWLYDPAVMLSEVLDWPAYPALRAALIAGYRRVRPLSAAHEALIDTFIALRRIQDALWRLDTPAHPALPVDPVAAAREALAPLPALLASTAPLS